MMLDRDHPDQVRCSAIDYGKRKTAKMESTRFSGTGTADVRKLLEEPGCMFDVGNEVAPETGTFRLEEIDRRKELRTRRSRELDP